MNKYTDGNNIVEAIQINEISSKYDENYAFNLWIDIVKDIKSQYSKFDYNKNSYQAFKYSYGDFKITARLDCSGYVYACLSCFLEKTLNGNSTSLATDNINGFEKIKFTNFNNLREGDIIVAPGTHAEIFAFNDGKNFKSWSVGENGIKNPSYGDSNTKYKYTTVQRPTFDNSSKEPEWLQDFLIDNFIISDNDSGHIYIESNNHVLDANVEDYIVYNPNKEDIELVNKNDFEKIYKPLMEEV